MQAMSRRGFDMPLRTVWAQVNEVRERFEEELSDLPEDVRALAVMTASELVENAIKYGEPVPSSPRATVQMETARETILIVVRNGSTDEQAVAALGERVRKIAEAEDRQALYLEQLEACMGREDGLSQLGIYRIACEGGFDLSLEYADQVVTMTATRRITEA